MNKKDHLINAHTKPTHLFLGVHLNSFLNLIEMDICGIPETAWCLQESNNGYNTITEKLILPSTLIYHGFIQDN